MQADHEKKNPGIKEGEKGAKLKYAKPVIKTENLTAVATLCNGTTTGGRKASGPCTRLKS